MKEKERDSIDDLFRSKLQDFEVDAMPGDWEAISSRLPHKAPVPFRRMARYWAAAAVISLLVISGGVYLINQNDAQMPVVAKVIQEETEATGIRLAEQTSSSVSERASEPIAVVTSAPAQASAASQSKTTAASQPKTWVAAARKRTIPQAVAVAADSLPAGEPIATLPETAPAEDESIPVQTKAQALIADAAPATTDTKPRTRRWGFGMGGGSVAAGTSNSLNTYAFKNTLMSDPELMHLNSPYFDRAPKTNIHHKTPISVGVGVSYMLNNRFSLQSGLNYSFLSSDWETNGQYYSETKQKLHVIGIPLSVSYKIAEWNRIRFYAAAGGMAEVNVAGKLQSKIFSGKDQFRHERENIRMNEWMWSVNARVGASYPLLRFLSVYAEAGADYYFDNGSVIETVRSDKPFNVSLQAGFRFGF